MSEIVITLGGNALGNSSKEQLARAQTAAKSIVDLVEQGHQVVIAHGNRPQVGKIRLAFKKTNQSPEDVAPFPERAVMSQGYIGYHLQQAIDEELVARNLGKQPVVTLITQVVVDPKDPALTKPTKPIDGYYDEEAAKQLVTETRNIYREDAGRGWRRVAPSPKPIDIYEKTSLRALVDAGQIVIACDDGGVPVAYDGPVYRGVGVVINKDFAAAKMAELIEADVSVVSTTVEHVFVNFGQANQQTLIDVTVTAIQQYIEENQFAPGSMLPKVETAISLAENEPNRQAIIGLLELASEAIKGESGTRITQ